METTMTYLPERYPEARLERKPFAGHPWTGRDSMGYGRKIPTDWIAWIGNRWKRVYCCCHSNAGTCYVLEHGSWLVVRDCDTP